MCMLLLAAALVAVAEVTPIAYASQATTCPEKFPVCDHTKKCLRSDCAVEPNSCSWNPGTTHIYGYAGVSGTHCTGNYQGTTTTTITAMTSTLTSTTTTTNTDTISSSSSSSSRTDTKSTSETTSTNTSKTFSTTDTTTTQTMSSSSTSLTDTKSTSSSKTTSTSMSATLSTTSTTSTYTISNSSTSLTGTKSTSSSKTASTNTSTTISTTSTFSTYTISSSSTSRTDTKSTTSSKTTSVGASTTISTTATTNAHTISSSGASRTDTTAPNDFMTRTNIDTSTTTVMSASLTTSSNTGAVIDMSMVSTSADEDTSKTAVTTIVINTSPTGGSISSSISATSPASTTMSTTDLSIQGLGAATLANALKTLVPEDNYSLPDGSAAGPSSTQASAAQASKVAKAVEAAAESMAKLVFQQNMSAGTVEAKQSPSGELMVMAALDLPSASSAGGKAKVSFGDPGNGSRPAVSLAVPSDLLATFGKIAVVGVVPGQNKALQPQVAGDDGAKVSSETLHLNIFLEDGTRLTQLPSQLELTLPRRAQNESSESQRCVFWNTSTNKWSTDGVVTVNDSTGGSVTCGTMHLSLFAALAFDAAQVFVCSTLSIFSKEGLAAIAEGDWWFTSPALCYWGLLSVLLLLIVVAKCQDIRDSLTHTWMEDLRSHVETRGRQASHASGAGKSVKKSAPPAGCRSIVKVLMLSSTLRFIESLLGACRAWISFLLDLRSMKNMMMNAPQSVVDKCINRLHARQVGTDEGSLKSLMKVQEEYGHLVETESNRAGRPDTTIMEKASREHEHQPAVPVSQQNNPTLLTADMEKSARKTSSAQGSTLDARAVSPAVDVTTSGSWAVPVAGALARDSVASLHEEARGTTAAAAGDGRSSVVGKTSTGTWMGKARSSIRSVLSRLIFRSSVANRLASFAMNRDITGSKRISKNLLIRSNLILRTIRLFLASHPWTGIMRYSLGMPRTARTVMLCGKISGFMAVCAVFALNKASSKKIDGCKINDDVSTSIVQGLAKGMFSALFADGLTTIISMMPVKPDVVMLEKMELAELEKELSYIRYRYRVFCFFSSLYMVGCTLIVLLYLSNVTVADQNIWLVNTLIAASQLFFWMPLVVAFVLALMVAFTLYKHPELRERDSVKESVVTPAEDAEGFTPVLPAGSECGKAEDHNLQMPEIPEDVPEDKGDDASASLESARNKDNRQE